MKTTSFLLLLIGMSNSGLKAQETIPPRPVKSTPETPVATNPDSLVCTMPHSFPVFEGGDQGLNQFIRNNLRYPQLAKEEGIGGKVYISLIVEKDGTVSHLKVARGIKNAPDLDQEALRLARLLKFKEPAKLHDQPVRTNMTIPFYFAIR